MSRPLLPDREPARVLERPRASAVDDAALAVARRIVQDVRLRGEPALLEHARRLGDLGLDPRWLLPRAVLREAFEGISADIRELLERTAARIAAFATLQRRSLVDATVAFPGGRAGHTLVPVKRVGCYAPGGRFPLPSSVLMTAVTARTAGVESICVASPRPTPIVLAAAYAAGASEVVAVGGAQAVAALAYGAGPLAPVDLLVGPGNRWVTAAKHVVHGSVGIDMLAGPSELVVLADESADPERVAADLLAQAEHDEEAMPMLVSTWGPLAFETRRALARQLEDLPTRAVARAALEQGFAVSCPDMGTAMAMVDALAPEHLAVMTRDASEIAKRARNAGAVFVGSHSAEALGDYGVGPNHVLPTGGTARHAAGLNVFTFLRPRTWLELTDPSEAISVIEDAAALARLEGLEGHARSALARLPASRFS